MSNDSIISSPNTWLEWFLTRGNAEDINRSSKRAIFEAFDSSKTEGEMKLALLHHQETAFLFKQNFGINKVNIFHHLNVVGGNFHQKRESFGFIQGVDEYVTTIVTPDIPQLLGISTEDTSVPPIEDRLGLDSQEEF